jgi:SAM-dependent methyltransferase
MTCPVHAQRAVHPDTQNSWGKNREDAVSTVYRIMYRVGFTPWEHEPLGPLVELIEGPDALPPGRMLDTGCGTGSDAIYAALHGWQVTGVDAVPLALDRARRSAQAAGAQVRFLQADITRIGASELGRGYTLLFDGGCLHGLTPAQRQRAAAAMTGAAGPGATLLIFAFGPGHRGPGPRGIDPAQIPSLFPQWDLAFSRPASEVALRGAIRNGSPSWCQLVKR